MNLTYDNLEFNEIIKDLEDNETVQSMKFFNHHCDTTCYEHCKHVSYFNYVLSKKMNLDYISAARAGMLHDLFLYDWRNSKKELNLDRLHAFIHPQIALDNSLKLFELNNKEQDIILKHMWPLTLSLPRFRESFLITLVDKYCALSESFDYFNRRKIKTLYRYAYVFFAMVIINI